MKRTFEQSKLALADEDILQVMVRDSLDEAARNAKKRKLIGALADNPLYAPYFEERFGDLVRRGPLTTLFYNHPTVTAETDSHPMRDIWPVILHFHRRLRMKFMWEAGRIQIFTTRIADAVGTFWNTGDILRRQFHYNVGESIGVFAQWHRYLQEIKEDMEAKEINQEAIHSCEYWSVAANNLVEWESWAHRR